MNQGYTDNFTYSFEVGSGINTETDGDVITYRGGSDDDWGEDDGLASYPEISSQRSSVFVATWILSRFFTLQQEGDGSATFADAQLLNRTLGTTLYRDIAIREESPGPDVDLKGTIGNNWFVGDNGEFGILASSTYKISGAKILKSVVISLSRILQDTEVESTYSVELSASINMGFTYTDDHEVTTTSFYLRNTDDETAISDFFNENREIPDGLGFRNYRLTYEQRDMRVNQINGTHYVGASTRDCCQP